MGENSAGLNDSQLLQMARMEASPLNVHVDDGRRLTEELLLCFPEPPVSDHLVYHQYLKRMHSIELTPLPDWVTEKTRTVKRELVFNEDAETIDLEPSHSSGNLDLEPHSPVVWQEPTTPSVSPQTDLSLLQYLEEGELNVRTLIFEKEASSRARIKKNSVKSRPRVVPKCVPKPPSTASVAGIEADERSMLHALQQDAFNALRGLFIKDIPSRIRERKMQPPRDAKTKRLSPAAPERRKTASPVLTPAAPLVICANCGVQGHHTLRCRRRQMRRPGSGLKKMPAKDRKELYDTPRGTPTDSVSILSSPKPPTALPSPEFKVLDNFPIEDDGDDREVLREPSACIILPDSQNRRETSYETDVERSASSSDRSEFFATINSMATVAGHNNDEVLEFRDMESEVKTQAVHRPTSQTPQLPPSSLLPTLVPIAKQVSKDTELTQAFKEFSKAEEYVKHLISKAEEATSPKKEFPAPRHASPSSSRSLLAESVGVELSPTVETDFSPMRVDTPNTVQHNECGKSYSLVSSNNLPCSDEKDESLTTTEICKELGKAEDYLEYLIEQVECHSPKPISVDLSPTVLQKFHESKMLLLESQAMERDTFEIETALIEAELVDIEKSKELEERLHEAEMYHESLLKSRETVERAKKKESEIEKVELSLVDTPRKELSFTGTEPCLQGSKTPAPDSKAVTRNAADKATRFLVKLNSHLNVVLPNTASTSQSAASPVASRANRKRPAPFAPEEPVKPQSIRRVRHAPGETPTPSHPDPLGPATVNISEGMQQIMQGAVRSRRERNTPNIQPGLCAALPRRQHAEPARPAIPPQKHNVPVQYLSTSEPGLKVPPLPALTPTASPVRTPKPREEHLLQQQQQQQHEQQDVVRGSGHLPMHSTPMPDSEVLTLKKMLEEQQALMKEILAKTTQHETNEVSKQLVVEIKAALADHSSQMTPQTGDLKQNKSFESGESTSALHHIVENQQRIMQELLMQRETAALMIESEAATSRHWSPVLSSAGRDDSTNVEETLRILEEQRQLSEEGSEGHTLLGSAIDAVCALAIPQQGVLPKEEVYVETTECSRLQDFLEEEFRSKPGTILDELTHNLRGEYPSNSEAHQKDTLIRLAYGSHVIKMRESVQEHFKTRELSYMEILCLWMYTAHGIDVDALMGFSVPKVTEKDEWAAYIEEHKTCNAERKRNGCIFSEVNWAMREMGKREGGFLEARHSVRKWCKLIMVLMNLTLNKGEISDSSPGLLYRGFAGQSAEAYKAMIAVDRKLVWPSFNSCTVDRDISVSHFDGTATSAKAGGAVLFTITNGFCKGFPLWRVSQYPEEKELLLSPFVVFDVVNSAESEELQQRLHHGLAGQGVEMPADTQASIVTINVEETKCRKLNDVLLQSEEECREAQSKILEVLQDRHSFRLSKYSSKHALRGTSGIVHNSPRSDNSQSFVVQPGVRVTEQEPCKTTGASSSALLRDADEPAADVVPAVTLFETAQTLAMSCSSKQNTLKRANLFTVTDTLATHAEMPSLFPVATSFTTQSTTPKTTLTIAEWCLSTPHSPCNTSLFPLSNTLASPLSPRSETKPDLFSTEQALSICAAASAKLFPITETLSSPKLADAPSFNTEQEASQVVLTSTELSFAVLSNMEEQNVKSEHLPQEQTTQQGDMLMSKSETIVVSTDIEKLEQSAVLASETEALPSPTCNRTPENALVEYEAASSTKSQNNQSAFSAHQSLAESPLTSAEQSLSVPCKQVVVMRSQQQLLSTSNTPCDVKLFSATETLSSPRSADVPAIAPSFDTEQQSVGLTSTEQSLSVPCKQVVVSSQQSTSTTSCDVKLFSATETLSSPRSADVLAAAPSFNDTEQQAPAQVLISTEQSLSVPSGLRLQQQLLSPSNTSCDVKLFSATETLSSPRGADVPAVAPSFDTEQESAQVVLTSTGQSFSVPCRRSETHTPSKTLVSENAEPASSSAQEQLKIESESPPQVELMIISETTTIAVAGFERSARECVSTEACPPSCGDADGEQPHIVVERKHAVELETSSTTLVTLGDRNTVYQKSVPSTPTQVVLTSTEQSLSMLCNKADSERLIQSEQDFPKHSTQDKRDHVKQKIELMSVETLLTSDSSPDVVVEVQQDVERALVIKEETTDPDKKSDNIPLAQQNEGLVPASSQLFVVEHSSTKIASTPVQHTWAPTASSQAKSPPHTRIPVKCARPEPKATASAPDTKGTSYATTESPTSDDAFESTLEIEQNKHPLNPLKTVPQQVMYSASVDTSSERYAASSVHVNNNEREEEGMLSRTQNSQKEKVSSTCDVYSDPNIESTRRDLTGTSEANLETDSEENSAVGASPFSDVEYKPLLAEFIAGTIKPHYYRNRTEAWLQRLVTSQSPSFGSSLSPFREGVDVGHEFLPEQATPRPPKSPVGNETHILGSTGRDIELDIHDVDSPLSHFLGGDLAGFVIRTPSPILMTKECNYQASRTPSCASLEAAVSVNEDPVFNSRSHGSAEEQVSGTQQTPRPTTPQHDIQSHPKPLSPQPSFSAVEKPSMHVTSKDSGSEHPQETEASKPGLSSEEMSVDSASSRHEAVFEHNVDRAVERAERHKTDTSPLPESRIFVNQEETTNVRQKTPAVEAHQMSSVATISTPDPVVASLADLETMVVSTVTTGSLIVVPLLESNTEVVTIATAKEISDVTTKARLTQAARQVPPERGACLDVAADNNAPEPVWDDDVMELPAIAVIRTPRADNRVLPQSASVAVRGSEDTRPLLPTLTAEGPRMHAPTPDFESSIWESKNTTPQGTDPESSALSPSGNQISYPAVERWLSTKEGRKVSPRDLIATADPSNDSTFDMPHDGREATDRIRQLTAELTDARAMLCEAWNEINKVVHLSSVTKKENITLKSTSSEVTREFLLQLEEAEEKNNSEIRKKEQQIEVLHEKLYRVTEELRESVVVLSMSQQLSREAKQSILEHEETRSELAASQREIGMLREKLEAKDSMIAQLQCMYRTADNVSNMSDSMKSGQLEILRMENTRIQTELSLRCCDCSSMRQQLAAVEVMNESLQAENDRLSELIIHATNSLEEFREAIKTPVPEDLPPPPPTWDVLILE